MHRFWVYGSAVLLSCSFAVAAGADLFVLSNGGLLEGELLNPEEKPRTSYIIKTSTGATLKLTEKQVKRVEVKSAAERRYEEILPGMPRTAEGNWKMAKWCGQYKLVEHREFHLQRAMKLDPNNVLVRHALGYSKVGGRWLIMEEYMRSQGYVRYRGSWRTKQAVALAEAAEKRELAEKDWRRKLKMWRGWFGKKKEQQGVAAIRSVGDPMAAAGLVDMLEKETSENIKKMYISVLGNLPTTVADEAFVRSALEDNSRSLRIAALEQLAKRNSSVALNSFIGELKSKDNRRINRAGVGLASLKNPLAIQPLIEAVTTTHKFVVKPRSGSGGLGAIGARFSNNGGGGGLTAGSKPKIITRQLNNQGVLDALVVLTDGENFRYDKQAWRDWYIEQHSARDVNLRRRDN